jgi:uncharacterized membrane protein
MEEPQMTTTETTDKKTNTVDKSIDVNVPISTAYNQWTQFESFPRFMNGVEEITQTDDTHNHWRVSIAGVKREFDAVITDQHPDEKVAWKSVDGTTHAGQVTFHRIDDNTTRVTVELEWKPEGLAEKAGAALQLDDVQVQQDLKNFKELIEDRGTEEGAWRGDVDNKFGTVT